jgi:EAL domain-containing protein (putative c-di-GMP-specific phosphodiesterase class I)
LTQHLVKAIEAALNPIYGSHIHDLQGGCCMLDDMGTEPDSAIAMESAVQYAMAVASKKLPAHFSKMRDRLKSIVDSEEILVLAQPIMNLKQGDIIGWEILTRGPVNTPYHLPAELFEFAYEADLLPKLELIVMNKAFQEIAERNIQEQVFINITPVSLGLPYFLNEVLNKLSRFPQISPSQIVFEITERHSIRDFAHMGSILAEYRAFGFRFAVDDAGSGYSSLQTISELIPDIIKIDKSVISNIDQVAVKQLLLKALVLFAQNINCQVIAEGVEREEESDMLQSLEVPMGQGFYFAKPESISHHRERVVHFSELKRKLLKPKVSSA